LKNFYEKNLIYWNKEIYRYLITKIINKNFSKKQIKNIFFEDCKIIYNFVGFIKSIVQKEIDEYPYIKLVKIKINENNIMKSIKNYITNLLLEILYKEEIELNQLETDIFGCQILADYIKKCDIIKYLDLSNSVFPSEGVECILSALESFDDYYILNLKGVTLSINNIKHIALIIKNPKKKILFKNDTFKSNKMKPTKGTLNNFKNFTFK